MLDSIDSISFPREEDVLRAIFSQISAEVRKTGVVLDEDTGSFYVSRRFSWKSTFKEFFDAYHKICERKQVPPIFQNSKLTTALKVPFASAETVKLYHDEVVKRLLQFQEKRIPPFNKLPENPSAEHLAKAKALALGDKDVCQFLDLVILIDYNLREYSSQLSSLSKAYDDRVEAFMMALKDKKHEKKARQLFDKSASSLISILTPYINKLKRVGVIPSSWKYQLGLIPLTDRAKSRLGSTIVPISNIEYFWEKCILPTKKATDADWHKRLRERAKYHRKDGRRLGSAKIELSRPSQWYRFDKWVSGIGDWFGYRMHDVSEWMMINWIWFLAAYLVIAFIAAWYCEGFFPAFLGVIVLFLIIRVLSFLLEFIVAIVAFIIKYLTCVPFFIFRCIFYRGWTLLLAVIGIIGFVTYKILQANVII